MDNFRDSYFQVDWDLTTKRLKGTYWGKQYDTGRGFAVTVINGGQVVAPTTEVLRLKWEKPDNTTGYVNATIVNGKFVVENIDQMFTVHGSVRADFELSVGGEFVASITFYVSVEKAVAVDAIESSSDFTALQDALADVGDMQAQVDAVIANVTVDSEVILARGTEPTLGARLDSTDDDFIRLKDHVGVVSGNSYDWELGIITIADGSNKPSTTRIRTIGFIAVDTNSLVSFNSYGKYDFYILEYNINKSFISGGSYGAKEVKITSANTSFIRVVIKKIDDSVFSEVEVLEATRSLSIYSTKSRWDSTDERVESIEKDTYITAKNIIANGDFGVNFGGWKSYSSGSLSVSDNILKVNGLGTSATIGTSTNIIGKLDSLYYTKVHARIIDKTGLVELRLMLSLSTGGVMFSESLSIEDVPEDGWIVLSGIGRLTGTQNASLIVMAKYADSASTLNKSVEIMKVLTVDLTETFGEDNEPSKDLFSYLLSQYPYSWFNGTVNLFNSKNILLSMLDQLNGIDTILSNLVEVN